MKGGITSGVAYPRATCELARTYSFKSIGGASAGAIAAASAAAAEYQRRKGASAAGSDTTGYARLAELPDWLARDGNLGNLFQANTPTQPLYKLLVKSLEATGGWFKKVRVLVFAAWRSFPRAVFAGLLVSIGLVSPLTLACILLWRSGAQPGLGTLALLLGYGSLFILFFLFLITCIFVAVGFALRASSGLNKNFYGLTTGLLDPEGNDPRPVLTTWLADEIDRIAGKSPRTSPLTFGDLWGASSTLDERWLPREEWGVRLQMMTTNLTLGRPYRLPFDDVSTDFFYDPEEWAKFFPAYIMKWLEEHPRQLTRTTIKERDEQEAERKRFEPRKPLPAPEHMPIVIAARMSLSFPILISAVPLWTVDRSRVLKDKVTGEESLPKLERCIFSDGGISSNFPIHFFDHPLPRWPTFGIDLQSFHPDYPQDPKDQSKNSYLVRTNAAGRADAWDRFDAKDFGFSRLTGFFAALINTMYNWADNTQMRVPGYRDRVVHIFQSEDEGGLNLNMPEEVVRGIGERGRFAGVKLRERFMGRDGNPLTWDNHRWIRYRSALSLVEELLRDLRQGATSQLAGDTAYDKLIARSETDPPPGYRLNEPEQRDFAAKLTQRLLDWADEWEREREQTGQSFAKGAPRPAPELRIRPRI
jgi:predicted acylesterase/phospholipase RssA